MAFLCPEHSPELPRSRNSPSGYFLRLPLNYTLSAKAVHACALLLSRLPCIHLFPRRLNIGPFHPTCNGLFNPTINGPYIPTCSGPFHPTLTPAQIYKATNSKTPPPRAVFCSVRCHRCTQRRRAKRVKKRLFNKQDQSQRKSHIRRQCILSDGKAHRAARSINEFHPHRNLRRF